MIKLNSISQVYRTEDIETTALKNISFNVSSGDFLMIMGPSGCGKSTLLATLGMLESPTSGDYIFMDQNISQLGETQLGQIRKNNIGFIFQNFNLIDELTVFENVELSLKYQGVSKPERKKRTSEILKKVGLEHRSGHYPQHLSGGQQQRVSVARALVINPKLILADEPTGNLDSKNGEDIMQTLYRLNQSGTTIVMVTHSEKDAQYGNRIIKILDGQLILDEAKTVNNEAQYA